ncbi:hypothetical protein AK812_SmicGene23742 [Symbiodinium microadriaticum]|uniref:Uncharacterized protein n=1 Tax=Symbiodinium microadriaticum TaxID=2951 RepID=A0A1Q9DGE9_SYMMI|nr:hypothetical protein AK812_SmicGene23742 [Symbiodinium microadriaticum]
MSASLRATWVITNATVDEDLSEEKVEHSEVVQVITNATVDEDLSEEKVEHSEVVQVGKAAGPRLRSILLRLIPQI